MEKRATRRTISRRKLTFRRKAKSEDVTGKDFSKQVPRQWREYYRRLIELRSFLRLGKRSQLDAAAEQNLRYSQHMGDVGSNSYEKDFALSRASSRQDTLFEIDAALDRIEEGTFGICELTGRKISAERLKAIPWTRFSAAAERELEERGEIERAHLPRSESVIRTPTLESVGEEWERGTKPVPAISKKKTRSRERRLRRRSDPNIDRFRKSGFR